MSLFRRQSRAEQHSEKTEHSSGRSGWQTVNSGILILHIILPVWLLAWIYTSAISGKLLLLVVVVNLLLGAVYRLVQKTGRGKAVLVIFRVLAVCSILLYYAPLVLMGSSTQYSKPLYPLKRLLYTRGVYGENASYYERILPESLPEVCEDYSFRTQGSMIAQDYHASSYLIFHTDAATLDAYAARMQAFPAERREYGVYEEAAFDKDAADNDAVAYNRDVEWIAGQTRLRQNYPDDLHHAVVYWISDYYPKAVLLNYETGLVVFLT